TSAPVIFGRVDALPAEDQAAIQAIYGARVPPLPFPPAPTGPPPAGNQPMPPNLYLCATRISHCAEYARKRVREIYREVLGRDADPAGLSYWTNEFTSGRKTEADLYASIGGGIECWNLYKDKTGWLTAYYAVTLGRAPTPSEVAYWSSVMG